MRKNACGLDRAAGLIVGTALAIGALGTSGCLTDRDDAIAAWQMLAGFVAAELLVTGSSNGVPATTSSVSTPASPSAHRGGPWPTRSSEVRDVMTPT